MNGYQWLIEFICLRKKIEQIVIRWTWILPMGFDVWLSCEINHLFSPLSGSNDKSLGKKFTQTVAETRGKDCGTSPARCERRIERLSHGARWVEIDTFACPLNAGLHTRIFLPSPIWRRTFDSPSPNSIYLRQICEGHKITFAFSLCRLIMNFPFNLTNFYLKAWPQPIVYGRDRATNSYKLVAQLWFVDTRFHWFACAMF